MKAVTLHKPHGGSSALTAPALRKQRLPVLQHKFPLPDAVTESSAPADWGLGGCNCAAAGQTLADSQKIRERLAIPVSSWGGDT